MSSVAVRQVPGAAELGNKGFDDAIAVAVTFAPENALGHSHTVVRDGECEDASGLPLHLQANGGGRFRLKGVDCRVRHQLIYYDAEANRGAVGKSKVARVNFESDASWRQSSLEVAGELSDQLPHAEDSKVVASIEFLIDFGHHLHSVRRGFESLSGVRVLTLRRPEEEQGPDELHVALYTVVDIQ